MAHTITRVDTTAEGWLYVEVDFGGGWVEDFLFPDIEQDVFESGRIEQVIEHHATKGYSGDRRDHHFTFPDFAHPLEDAARKRLMP